MSLPKPLEQLTTGGCSAIYDDTLYVYQPNAFQTLELKEGGEWRNLTNGVSVQNPKCVIGAQEGKDALFIVGGLNDDPEYAGLQRYVFQDRKWESINTVDLNLQNRQMHGAAFLNATNSMLIYAGFQDSRLQNSSQTFTFSLTPPFTLRSWTSRAPPVVDPILLPWNESHAVMAGGSPTNQQVWVFSEADGWRAMNVVLPTGLPDMTKVQASLIQGNNGSKILELFDLTQSPNTVTSLQVQTEGELSSGGAALVPRQMGDFGSKEIDLAQWPQYNDTEAPSETREGYSLAQSTNGLVVITGGDDAQEPIAIFNQTGNSWLSAGQFFDPQAQREEPSATTPSPTDPTISLTPTAPASADEEGDDGEGRTRVLLGSILGSIAGIAILILIALILLRYYKRRKRRLDIPEDPHRLNVDDSGVVMRGASPDSIASLKRGVAKNMISRPNKPATTFPSVFTSNSPTPSDEERAKHNRGWSSYFQSDRDHSPSRSNGLATSSNQPASGPANSDPSRLTAFTEESSYSESSRPHGSAEVPPLALRASSQAYPHRSDDDDTFLEGTSSSERTGSWSPLRDNSYGRRPVSSMYDNMDSMAAVDSGTVTTGSTGNGPHPGQRVLIGQFPAPGGGRLQHDVTPKEDAEEDRGLRTMATRNFGYASGPVPNDGANDSEEGSASFREGPERRLAPNSSEAGKGQKGVVEDDMSWLNLGANK